MTFREFIQLREVSMYPDFPKDTLKAKDRSKPYWTLVHRSTGHLFKWGPQTHKPGYDGIHYFKDRKDAEDHRYSLGARMNDYFPRRQTAQLFTDTGEHPDEVVINPEIDDYPNVLDFT